MWASSRSRIVAITGAATVLAIAAVAPLVHLLVGSLAGAADGRSLAAVLWVDARQRGLLSNTAILGLGTAVLASVIGAPLGVALARIDLRWKAAWRMLLAAPVLLPPYVVGLAWISIGRDALSSWTYSMPAAIGVLALVCYPMSMLATEVAVRRIEPRLEEAALIVTHPRRVLWHITLRLAAPSIAAAALAIFVLAISEFGVPGLLRVRVFTTEVFTAFAALYDVDRAVLLTLPLLLVSTTVAAVAVAMVGERLVTTRRGASVGEVPLFQALKPVVVVAAVTMILLALVLPVVQLLREVLAGQPAAGVLPLQGRRAVFTALGWDGSGAAIRNSLVWSGIGATLTVTIGGLLGYSRARAGRRVGFLTDLLFVVLFAVPSTVVGVALIGFWNRSGPFGVVYGTSAMVWLASVARFLPVAALGMAAAVRHVPISHEEAAAAAGAGWTRTMVYVVVPQLVAAIAAVWVVVFVLAFGELGASLLVAPPGESTLPIRIYTLIANAPPAQVASLALLQTIVILSPLALLAGVMAARTAR